MEEFTTKVKDRFPEARFAFDHSSSFKRFNDENPLTFSELGAMGVKFPFIAPGSRHAMGHGLNVLPQDMAEQKEQGYIALQRKEWDEGKDFPTKSRHFFFGVPYHHLVGKEFDSKRLGMEFVEELPDDKVV